MLLGLVLQALGMVGWGPRSEDIRLARQGTMAELEAFVNSLRPDALRTVGVISAELADFAEDICQEAYASLLAQEAASFRRFRGDSSLKTFVLNVVRNKALDERRRRQRRPEEELPEEELALAAPQAVQPERAAERAEVRRLVHEAVAELPPRLQQVVALHYVGGLTFREIAEMLALSRGRVANLLIEARERLRTRLAELE